MLKIKEAIPASLRSLPWRFRWLAGTESYARAPALSAAKLLKWTALELMNSDANFVTAEGAQLRSMARNFTSLSVYLTGERDRELQAFIRRRLSAGDTFLDVGANVGVYSAFASKLVGNSGRVLAIEAHPATYRYLIDNLARNEFENVTALNLAAGEAPGQLQIAMTERNAGETHIATATERGAVIPVERLDDLLTKCGIKQVHYLKIDVEGFELPVLRGACEVMAASPAIVVQTELVASHARRYGYEISDIVRLLTKLGLKPYKADAKGDVAVLPISDIGLDWDVLWMAD